MLNASQPTKDNKTMNNYYKYEEIKSYFEDFITGTDKYLDDKNLGQLHQDCFNTDHYIIGIDKAKKWLGENVFDIIKIIKNYEEDNFGEVFTDLSCPEKVVNMYVYIIGEEIVNNFINDYTKTKEVV